MDSLCADTDRPDRGHLVFVYFAKATALVGSAVQSTSSFNSLRSEKLKRCVCVCVCVCVCLPEAGYAYSSFVSS